MSETRSILWHTYISIWGSFNFRHVDFEDVKRQARDLWLWLKLTIPMDNISSRSSSQECHILYILGEHDHSES